VDEEAARRRKRTRAYLSMWAVDADVDVLPVLLDGDASIRSAEATVGRAKALCLCSLKGQGFTQHETFAFADAYEVWDHLSATENDFVLDPSPSPEDLVQNAWLCEGLWALEWALGIARHLAFPDHPADTGEATRLCLEQFCVANEVRQLRARKDLLDALDVAVALDALCDAARAQGIAPPGNLHAGVVFERRRALGWLVSRRS
jgi:Domain of unknown function (DUF4272)